MMSSLSPYIRLCTICNKGFTSDFEWLNHLLFKSHQDQAWMDCGKWMEDVMECCVAVFTSNTVKLHHRIVLNHFCKVGCGLVTDFLWSLERRNVFLLQFESRDKVEELFKIVGASETSIDSHKVQLRRLREYMTFERQVLFPGVGDDESLKSTEATAQQSRSPHQPSSSESSRDVDPRYSDPKSLLLEDYQDICESVEISNDDFTKVLSLMEKLQTILEKHFSGCQLFLFRHWYLKLKTIGTNELLIFVRHDILLEATTTRQDYNKIFQGPEAQEILPGLKMVDRANDVGYKDEPHGKTFMDTTSGIRFSLIDSKQLLTETLTCQLVKHLCRFDRRVRALLKIVMYWAGNNKILFQKKADFTTQSTRAYSTPIPAALEWLVIFFLTYKHVIPTITHLMAEVGVDRCWSDRLSDPGFPMKSDFIQNEFIAETNDSKPNSSFIISVLKLAEKFFSFYGCYVQKQIQTPCVLNTRNGHIIKAESMEKFPESQVPYNFVGNGRRLTVDEMKILKNDALVSGITSSIHCQVKENLEAPIYILHPLHYKNSFPLDEAKLSFTWSNMSKTGEQLRFFIKQFENPSESADTNFLSLKKILNPNDRNEFLNVISFSSSRVSRKRKRSNTDHS